MAQNNKVQLIGNLGAVPKIINKNGKRFATLSVCTTDHYQQGGEWKAKQAIWHKIIVFRSQEIEIVRTFHKGDRIHLFGSLSYRPIQTVDGYTVQEASIIAHRLTPAPLRRN